MATDNAKNRDTHDPKAADGEQAATDPVADAKAADAKLDEARATEPTEPTEPVDGTDTGAKSVDVDKKSAGAGGATAAAATATRTSRTDAETDAQPEGSGSATSRAHDSETRDDSDDRPEDDASDDSDDEEHDSDGEEHDSDDAVDRSGAPSAGFGSGAAAVVSAGLGLTALVGSPVSEMLRSREELVGQIESGGQGSAEQQIDVLYSSPWHLAALVNGVFALLAVILGGVLLAAIASRADTRSWVKSVALAGVVLGALGLFMALGMYFDLFAGTPTVPAAPQGS
ncbi:hypothetical protein MTQ01_03135 [Streptomyces sp. XM4193]|uniref:hypothetical protein n=1 Tax=Streptomyces sp. XM4193 TaxID=2929782 RepID=UPI001FFBCA08|nr:hypothetical protein [Streptomyces sp. XM4193]MCK1795026.1 hypothetical protein [Streptomyces sp. XM4193]